MREFDINVVKDEVIQWIKDYFAGQDGARGAVIGISGGKDSTVVSKLLVEALGKENIFGVLMPNGEQADIDDSLRVVEELGIRYRIVNIEQSYDGLLNAIGNQCISLQGMINISPRLRMTALYAISSTMGYRVAGTGNKSECYVGYTTKWGDSACDFNPVANLTTEQVVALGDALSLPYDLVHKTPSDGLCGKSDEENLGFSYSDVNKFMENGTCGDAIVDEKIKIKHEYNLHKRNAIPSYEFK